MNSSKSHCKETRRRALTSLPLPRLVEEISITGMELEDDEDSYHQIASGIQDRYMSPDSNAQSKQRLNSTCVSTFQSVNKYFATSEKNKEQVFDEIYFDNCFDKYQLFSLNKFLTIHEITEKFRGKMMDWMIEVLKIYKQKEETIFKSFFLLDLYMSHRKTTIKTSELHLIGTVCMFIASKQEEIAPIRLNVFYEEVCKKKFTKEEIVEKEIEILKVIQFKTQFPTLYDLCRCGLRLVFVDDREISLFIENISLLIAKMCVFSCSIVDQYSYPEIVTCALILSLKLVENLKGYFTSESHVY